MRGRLYLVTRVLLQFMMWHYVVVRIDTLTVALRCRRMRMEPRMLLASPVLVHGQIFVMLPRWNDPNFMLSLVTFHTRDGALSDVQALYAMWVSRCSSWRTDAREVVQRSWTISYPGQPASSDARLELSLTDMKHQIIDDEHDDFEQP